MLQVLPAAMRDVTTACEAGVTSAWYKYAAKVPPAARSLCIPPQPLIPSMCHDGESGYKL